MSNYNDEHGFSAHAGCVDEDDDATIIKKLRAEIAILTGINRAQANIIEQIQVKLQHDAPDLEFIRWVVDPLTTKTSGGGH
jgi:hypothetical protein